eukprot:746919-Hanusia_phi.AAC.1
MQFGRVLQQVMSKQQPPSLPSLPSLLRLRELSPHRHVVHARQTSPHAARRLRHIPYKRLEVPSFRWRCRRAGGGGGVGAVRGKELENQLLELIRRRALQEAEEMRAEGRREIVPGHADMQIRLEKEGKGGREGSGLR